MSFTKRDVGAAPGFYEAEAAGLRWLGEAQADGGVAVADIEEVTATSITLPRYATVDPTDDDAREFGRRLALTHAAGAPYHGAPPPGVRDGFIATLALPHLAAAEADHPPRWGEFYVTCRLEPFARAAEASGSLRTAAADDVRAICERLRAGDQALTGPEVAPARLHGDLWSGNVLWTAQGARLIDPAAHGGHPETDLAMLALFGLPHLEEVLAAYDATSPLPIGWRERVGLHQLHPLLVHAVLFGPSYGSRAGQVARGYR
jgi:fructosamine-3-kinase